jgi:hypothetical protein
MIGFEQADDLVAAPQRHRDDALDVAAHDRFRRGDLSAGVGGQDRCAIGQDPAQDCATGADRIDDGIGFGGAAPSPLTGQGEAIFVGVGPKQDRDVGRSRHDLERGLRDRVEYRRVFESPRQTL